MDRHVLDIIVCPLCKGQLEFDKAKNELVCRFDKLAFPIENDIPVMLEEKARQINTTE